MRTQLLEGPALTWAVLWAQGVNLVPVRVDGVLQVWHKEDVYPFREEDSYLDPKTGEPRFVTEDGPVGLSGCQVELGAETFQHLVEEYGIEIKRGFTTPRVWAAWAYKWDGLRLASSGMTGPTALIAVARCFVAVKLGQEVELPALLMPQSLTEVTFEQVKSMNGSLAGLTDDDYEAVVREVNSMSDVGHADRLFQACRKLHRLSCSRMALRAVSDAMRQRPEATSSASDPLKPQPLAALKPSVVLRRIKSGQIKEPQRGRLFCAEHRHPISGDTESPSFWENGSYIFCGTCGHKALARPEFDGFYIDLTGERKKYPFRMEEGDQS